MRGCGLERDEARRREWENGKGGRANTALSDKVTSEVGGCSSFVELEQLAFHMPVLEASGE